MKLYKLAKRIAKFVWDNTDLYEIHDIGIDYPEFETETFLDLCDSVARKGIIRCLEDFEDAEAKILLSEVNAI